MAMTYLTYIESDPEMSDIQADLSYSQNELSSWLDETRAPLSDDEMVAMSAYFDSDSFRHEEEILLRKE